MVYKMFCYQCQETSGCSGCTQGGVCGKTARTANLQDLLVYASKGLAAVLYLSGENGEGAGRLSLEEDSRLLRDNLFATITNANFDDEKLVCRIFATQKRKEEALRELNNPDAILAGACESLKDAVLWMPGTKEEILDLAGDRGEKESSVSEIFGILSAGNEDIRSLRELITYGLKGMAAYLKHADVLGKRDEETENFMIRALSALADDRLSAEELLSLAMETGKFGVSAMALLDRANTERYGSPEITEVELGVRKNPGILISGHDLRDLEMLLEQTEGTGVDVYTHSEMLPAHYYPAFKKYSHFAGNYGNAWWKQTEEFEAFNGPVILTTNCLVPPRASYRDRVYTTGAVGFPGCRHIEGDSGEKKDFSAVIEQARHCEPPRELERGTITGGFAHSQVLALADKIVEAVKKGAVRKFVVMAGCDGRQQGRSYYTEFAEALPKDTVILTAGCAKYRYNKLNLGTIEGIPRVLDAGQCNDSYSLAVIAMKLKEVFGMEDINDLPIVYNIAWYEQKAVIVLLALLHLGIKNIHLGPTLPAFLSPGVARILTEKFGIQGITEPQKDMERMEIL